MRRGKEASVAGERTTGRQGLVVYSVLSSGERGSEGYVGCLLLLPPMECGCVFVCITCNEYTPKI